MKKITDFIVNKRYLFLMLFLLLAGFSLFLSTKVNINEDIMAYLPKDSETKLGKDIMEEEFSKEDTSTLNVMFKNLSEEEKIETLENLKNIEGVSVVEYENTKNYNINEYTLYVIKVEDSADSKTSSQVYQYVKDHFKVSGMSGSIYDENKPVLELWIVFLAIMSAMVLLIIFSDSYIEPWLYLLSIGIAVFINKGTNIIFPNVSSITNSIVAILQLALSMDYSIMLSNRYAIEKRKFAKKEDAMKEALYHSFLSISSSSVTTIVGLVALVFMSFTIGKDLGFVLAKGVLLSLLSIFFCLPALLLLFDHLIEKTKKRSPKFSMTKLGSFSYKTRYVQLALIFCLFILAYFLKGNVNILYTDSEQDQVGKIFPATNQMAIVYNNKYEDVIKEYCKKLEQDEKIDQVLCYSNTINEKLAYNELNGKLESLNEETKIDEYLIKLIYYHYYNQEEENKMTFHEFVQFIKSDLYVNENFKNSIDQNTKDNVDLLENFTSPTLINKKRTTSEIANLLSMSNSDAENILLYYNSKKNEMSMTLKDFISFLLNDVVKDERYQKSFDEQTLHKLKQLQNFTNINTINKKMNATELSNIFGIDKDLIEQLFLFYRTTVESKTKMTLNDFASFALELSKEEPYQNQMDEETKKSLNLLKTLSDEVVINKKMTNDDLEVFLNELGIKIDPDTLMLLSLYYNGANTKTKLTLSEFADLALEMSQKSSYASYFNPKLLTSLQKIETLSATSSTKLGNTILYQMFEIDEEISKMLNLDITQDENGSFNKTPLEFVNLLLTNEKIKTKLSKETKESLKSAQLILSHVKDPLSVEELANLLNVDQTVDQTIPSMVYGVFMETQGLLENISFKEWISFLYNHKTNPYLSSKLSTLSSTIDKAYLIMSNRKTTYDYKGMSEFTKTSSTLVKQIYGIYDYRNKSTTLTPLEFANFILKNKENELLKGKISKESLNELSLVTEVMTQTINGKKYVPKEMSALLNIENNTVSLLYSLYDSKYLKTNSTISLKDYVDFIVTDVMNQKEYSSSFDAEKKKKLVAVQSLMNASLNSTLYTSNECLALLDILSEDLDHSLIQLVYMYYGSEKEYDDSWKMTIEEFVNYLNSDILTDQRFDDFLNSDKKTTIIDSKEKVEKNKKLIVSNPHSRVVLNTKYPFEDESTYQFINQIHDDFKNMEDIYVVGNSPMAVEISKTFDEELNKITLLTMIFIFVVVAISFKDLIIPFVLVLIIQTAVYITMSAISLTGGSVYFIALLIVQAILMGATIDYAIVYTSYYRESRLTMSIKDSVLNAYQKSIHTILSSSSILIIVTLVVAHFASAIAAKICETISQGTLASAILILFVLPGVLAATDKFICRKGYYHENKKIKE